jgi:small subunit ribosomal protein S20
MVVHKSAVKRARQNKKIYIYNRAIKSALKTGIKNLLTALESKNSETVHSQLKKVIVSFNKAATKGVIHKKTASRRISRLTKRVNKLSVA